MERDIFGRRLLFDLLKLTVGDILCLQWNAGERSYDLTLKEETKYQEVLAAVKTQEGVRPYSAFNIMSLSKLNFRIITVHMYNPHVSDLALTAFLGQYGEVLSGARYIKDPLGLWTGRRQFQVLLKEDREGLDDLSHPPAFFSLGADRGFLYYNRQPQFCRRCKGVGHVERDCGGRRCRFCQSEDHETRHCREPKKCHGCGLAEHLFRDCPSVKQTYAAAAGPSGAGSKGRWPQPTRVQAAAKDVPPAETREGLPAVRANQPVGIGIQQEPLRPIEEVIGEILERVQESGGVVPQLHPQEGSGVAVTASGEEAGQAAPRERQTEVFQQVEELVGTLDGGSSVSQSVSNSGGRKKKREQRRSEEGSEVEGLSEDLEREEGSKRAKPEGEQGPEEMEGEHKGSEESVLGGTLGEQEGDGGEESREGVVSDVISMGEGSGQHVGGLEVGGGVTDSEAGSSSSPSLTLSQNLFSELGSFDSTLERSPLGEDGYGGPLRPSTRPNAHPYSWAESEASGMETDEELYGT